MKVIDNEYSWAFDLTARKVTTHLILHHAAASQATADGIHAYHLSKGWAGIAYHYFVSKAGEIFAGRPENMRGGHTTNWNYCSIGICFEGNFEAEYMTEAQLKAGKALVDDIISRYPGIVVGRHSDYGQTACPGRNFPFYDIVSEMENEPDGNADKADEPSDWAKSSCEWAKEKGLFLGNAENNFRWHDSVTREELAVVLERAEQLISQK